MFQKPTVWRLWSLLLFVLLLCSVPIDKQKKVCTDGVDHEVQHSRHQLR